MNLRPHSRIFWGTLLWLVIGLAASFQEITKFYWQIYGIGLLIIALYDARYLWQFPTLTIQRRVTSSLPLGVWTEVTLTVHNSTSVIQQIEIFDDYPLTSELQGLPQNLLLPPQSSVETTYRLCPQQRGTAIFTGVHLLLHSPWRFWKHRHYYPIQTEIRVYPNFATVTKYTLLATANRLGQLGIRKIQQRGEGSEFRQLREYRAGDSLRQIDWNTTSRLKKLISKEYQEERDQRIILLLDCGRRMLTQDGPLSHFDHTLNAILLLAYVALHQGDALGLMTFSSTIQRWLPPRKGMNTLNFILNTVYDLQPTLQTSDYVQTATHLMLKQNKRALVILISNLRDEENDELLSALHLLRKKHLVLLVSLQEPILTHTLECPVDTFEEALRYVAVYDYLQQRYRSHELIKQQGILYLDTPPEQLAVKMVNRYLEIKRGGQL